MTRYCSMGTCAILALGLAIGLPATSVADSRIVCVEDFMATWCTYCPYAGRALNTMITNHPHTLIYLQIHGNSDALQIPWGVNRATYYGVSGYPTAWFDGKLKCVGALENDTQQYNWYNTQYSTRISTPTDVTLELGGEQLSGNTYRITARLSLCPNGAAKTVRLYMLHALDNYPSSTDHRHRMCLRPPAPTASPWWVADVALTPGQWVDTTRDFTFDTTSMAHTADIRIVAWAQKPAASGSTGEGEFWNARMLVWPFQTLPAAPPLHELGDLNCDGLVDFDDIDPFVLAVSDPDAYRGAFPACDINLADCNVDCTVSFNDIDAFVWQMTGR